MSAGQRVANTTILKPSQKVLNEACESKEVEKMNVDSDNLANDQPSSSNGSKNRICRDFIRSICRRKYCRYPHVVSSDLVVFCHDFQNTYCPRVNCKFLHYSIEEEEHYRKFGEFPQQSDVEKNQPRYNRGDFRFQRDNEPSNDRMQPAMGYRSNSFNECHFLNPRDYPPRGNRGKEFGIKRPSADRYDEGFKRFREDGEQPDIMAIIRKFEEEQAMLRRRVEANEIKIAELRASNEYLIAQNAQLRLNTVQVSRVVSTVTSTTPQQAGQAQPTQVINAVSMAPVQVATPIVSMATAQQPTLIASNGSQTLAIATNTSQGQQLTLAQPNISTLNTSTQQLTPINQITLTPTLAPAPLAINTSQALAISNATQPIISYPIMTHSILPH